MRDADGKICGVVGVAVDVTDRRRAEDALRESEARLRTIIETEPECVKLVDEQGRLLDMNPAGLAMIEADGIDTIRGQPIVNIVAPEHRAAFTDMHRRVFAGEAAGPEPHDFRRLDVGRAPAFEFSLVSRPVARAGTAIAVRCACGQGLPAIAFRAIGGRCCAEMARELLVGLGHHYCSAIRSSAAPSGDDATPRESRISALRITSSGAPNCNAILQTTAASRATASA